MATVGKISNFSGGIADSAKLGGDNTGAFMRSVEYRRDARKLKLLPASVKDSSGIITDLPMWAERVIVTGDTYIYGNTGNLYLRDTAATYSLAHLAPSSHGNGIGYFGEDGYLYYAQDITIGRYGRIGQTPQWYDDFLGSEGGAPTNISSLSLVAASSMYAKRASTASLSQTGPLTLEAYIKPTTLPATGSSMTLVGKWDASGATRSYLMDIKGTSNSFGDGSDGALSIAADTTEAPVDSACTGTIGAYTLSATNVGFAANKKIMIHQSQGTGAGTVQYTSIQSYTAGTITLTDKLNATYTTGAQVRVIPQYTNVTIASGKTYTAKAWNGTTGGILAFYANGTTTVTGTISASSKGFRTGLSRDWNTQTTATRPTVGENETGTQPINQRASVGNGGGAGIYVQGVSDGNQSGGGGGNGTVGFNSTRPTGGFGGSTTGTTDLTSLLFGGGGGGYTYQSQVPTDGSSGGGIIFLCSSTLTVTGGIVSSGGNVSGNYVSGGAGAGGSILLRSQSPTLGDSLVKAIGGVVTNVTNPGANGGDGRICLDYMTSYTGTTLPTVNPIIDDSLNTTGGYVLRLGISTDGTAEEYFQQDITPIISVGQWNRFSITYDNSVPVANFYNNGTLLGSKYGTANAISSNSSEFSVGSNKGASAYQNFFDGLIDDVRVWGTIQLGSALIAYNDQALSGNEAYLKACYKFDGDYTDATAFANTLTAVNTPTFSTDVPFAGVTTRQDQDTSASGTGQTYTLPTTISEAATARQTFIANKDPQKSIRVYISAIGTGDWTLTVHDPLNRIVSYVTVPNAQLHTGFFEFMLPVWRPVIGATYHFHLTSTVADGTVRTQTTGDLETSDYATFFQFLVSDTFHPIMQITNQLAIGNERYVATYDGLTYNPMTLILPPGYRVRCFTLWREYLVIGTWKGTTVKDYDEGKIFFWDGISVTYNFFMDVPEGAINAMIGTRDSLYIIAGYSNDLLLYNGYLGSGQAQKVKRLPDFDNATYVEVFPGAITMWRALIHMGIAGNSDSTVIQKGVYTWGSLNKAYPESLNYDYPISTGTRTGNGLKIGMVKSVGSKLLIGWQDGTAFGVDTVDSAGSCATSGTYEALIEDADFLAKSKLPLIAKVDFSPLEAGQSVGVKYRADRDTDYRGITENTVGVNNIRMRINDRFREIQIATDIMSTGGVSPEVYGISLEADLLQKEKDV